MNYYWLSYYATNKETGYSHLKDVTTTIHPFITIKKLQGQWEGLRYTINNWKEITRQEYLLWSGGHLPVEDSVYIVD